MKYSISCCVTIAFLLYQSAFARNLPAYLSVCNRNSPKLSQCYKDNLQNLGPHLANGISELQIPPISKLVIPLMHLGQMDTSNVKVNSTLKDVKFVGLEKYDVIDAKINLDDPFLSYQLHLEKLDLNFINAAKGKVLVMTLDGEANVTSKNKDVKVKCEWEGEKYSQDGKEHLKFKVKNRSSTISYLEADIKGFFKQNPEIDAAFNQMFKENVDSLRPEIEMFLAEIVCGAFTAFQNQVFNLFDLEQLFPSN